MWSKYHLLNDLVRCQCVHISKQSWTNGDVRILKFNFKCLNSSKSPDCQILTNPVKEKEAVHIVLDRERGDKRHTGKKPTKWNTVELKFVLSQPINAIGIDFTLNVFCRRYIFVSYLIFQNVFEKESIFLVFFTYTAKYISAIYLQHCSWS
jgi:hypothetical protein